MLVCGIAYPTKFGLLTPIEGVKKNALGYQTPPPLDISDQKAPYGIIKLSVVFFYRRVFLVRKMSVFDIVTKITILVIIAWTVAFFIRYIFICGTHPAADWYGVYNWEAYCPMENRSKSALIISELITAILVLGLPLPVVRKLFLLRLPVTAKLTKIDLET